MNSSPEIYQDPGFWTKTSMIQLLYGIWVNVSQLAVGLAYGFPGVQVPQLTMPNSNVQITRSEAAWIASVMNLFSPIGCLLSGYLMDRFGRKVVILICQVPMFLGWLYTGLSVTSIHIIIGRAITGIGCGMALGPPRLYTSEISLPNMRGVIGAFPDLALSIGLCVQAGLGGLLKWQLLCFICCIFTGFSLILFSPLPETPYYVLMKGSPEDARKALAKFRGKDYDLDYEMNQLLEFKMDNNIRTLTLAENLKALFTRASCKPFSLINTYLVMAQASGVNAVLMWGVDLLTTSKSTVNVKMGNFLIALTRLFFGTITSILLFRVGRKPLALFSAAGVSTVCLGFATYISYYTEPSVIPQICFMAYMAFASSGYYIFPFLMMSELYPLQVRGMLGGITVSIASIAIFGSSKLYPVMVDNIGLVYTMVVFGISSLIATMFLYYFLPETKDLTLQEIEEYYNLRRPTMTSQRQLMSRQQFLSRQILSTSSITRAKPSSDQSKKIKLKNILKKNKSKSSTRAEDQERKDSPSGSYDSDKDAINVESSTNTPPESSKSSSKTNKKRGE